MCILLVEDEFLIRTLMAEELAEAGFTLREAADGDEAFELIDGAAERWTILVTDIDMPGSIDGIELAKRFRSRHPKLPVIFTTGLPDALNKLRGLDNLQTLLRKPYAPTDLVGSIRGMLDQLGDQAGR